MSYLQFLLLTLFWFSAIESGSYEVGKVAKGAKSDMKRLETTDNAKIGQLTNDPQEITRIVSIITLFLTSQ